MFCPNCGNEWQGDRCGVCGYDRSSDALRFPTLTLVEPGTKASRSDRERKRVSSLYDNALEKENAAVTEENFAAAARLYRQIGKPGWRDSEKRARRCGDKARQLKKQEQERLEQEQRERERRERERKEQLERERKERELREQQERERREQLERERKEREQKEREQKEREQRKKLEDTLGFDEFGIDITKEFEQLERERKERERREQLERERKERERKEREQKEREQKEREQRKKRGDTIGFDEFDIDITKELEQLEREGRERLEREVREQLEREGREQLERERKERERREWERRQRAAAEERKKRLKKRRRIRAGFCLLVLAAIALVLWKVVLPRLGIGTERNEALRRGEMEAAERRGQRLSMAAHTVGVKPEGTVLAVGYDELGQCQVSDWTNIVAVSAGFNHTLGLMADGTAVDSYPPLCDVSGWRGISAISAGNHHAVGLMADGTVTAAGIDDYGQCGVSEWRDIVAVAAGGCHTVGLKADGTVVAVGQNDYGQCEVSEWRDIVAISAGQMHTVGLKADGTAVAVGKNDSGQCSVSGWKEIVAVSAGFTHTAGLKRNGSVISTGSDYFGEDRVSGWTDILAITAGYYQTAGLKADGTVVIAGGYDGYPPCDVSGWNLGKYGIGADGLPGAFPEAAVTPAPAAELLKAADPDAAGQGTEGVSLALDRLELTLADPGDTFRLAAEVSPGQDPAQIAWRSEDPAVAVVDENGLVTAVNHGDTRIFAVLDGCTRICSVRVEGYAPGSVEAWRDRARYPELEALPGESGVYGAFIWYTVAISGADGVNMRSGPGTSYTKIGTVPDGARVGAAAKSEGGKWSLVCYAGKFGWVSNAYLIDAQGD